MNSLLLTCFLLFGFFVCPVGAVTAAEKPKNMIWIKPGTFWMGSSEFADATPVHQVELSGFWLDKTEVTNDEFAQFVKATGYKTVAERTPKAEDFPGAKPENLVAGALVFAMPAEKVRRHHLNWWRYVPGANWQHPYGPDSNISGRGKFPVVQIAYEDADAYSKWAGKRLPTEAEFEFASRGGLDGKKYSWGDEFKLKGKWQANIWQGNFPYNNTKEDGFAECAPVARFSPNGYGLFDMTGNVWEWCSDWYRPDYFKHQDRQVTSNPKGPENSFDPKEPNVAKRVQKGGSFLCTGEYCARYMVGARGKGEPTSGCLNVGFRCAKDADK